jgi:hypothetical protein
MHNTITQAESQCLPEIGAQPATQPGPLPWPGSLPSNTHTVHHPVPADNSAAALLQNLDSSTIWSQLATVAQALEQESEHQLAQSQHALNHFDNPSRSFDT